MSQMSQSEQDLAEQAISLVLTLRKETYCAVAASALVLFDHFSTVIREIEYMWRRPVKIPTILFLVNRWTMLTWAAVILIGIFMPVSSTTGCAVIGYLTDAVSMVLFVLWGAFSTIRINAVSLNNWPLTLVVFMVSMAPAGTNASFRLSIESPLDANRVSLIINVFILAGWIKESAFGLLTFP
ncbi:hypothetical protein CERSUDRAFT_95203 [Gelatoporia subvermispora B]|uniref:DUF6533 domain-containing protein n=1 Tax=Ceriporiopsis subvermispora (strain B) TaxID=914234 RepID=M2QIV0_CERS8|nr:hypothetical protein CERSUDRAFT_95203 [Gelatoporia subvermispora B]